MGIAPEIQNRALELYSDTSSREITREIQCRINFIIQK